MYKRLSRKRQTCKTRPLRRSLFFLCGRTAKRDTPSFVLMARCYRPRRTSLGCALANTIVVGANVLFRTMLIPIHVVLSSRPRSYLPSAIRLILNICHDDSRHPVFVMRLPRLGSLALTLHNPSNPLLATRASISNAALRVKADRLRLRRHASCITVVRFTFVCPGLA